MKLPACENPACSKKLTKKQVQRKGRFCGNPCSRTLGTYKKFNSDPSVFGTDKSGRGHW